MSSSEHTLPQQAGSLPAAGEAPTATGHARRHVRMPELAAQSIGLVGVSGGVGMLIPAVFSSAGSHTWLAYGFAVVALLFASWSIVFFAREIASSGALYTFATMGLGTRAGLLCGSCLLMAYVVGGAGILLGTVDALVIFLQRAGSLHMSAGSFAFPVALIAGLSLLGWWLGSRDIRVSTRVTLLVELVTVGLIAFLLIRFLSRADLVADTGQFDLQHISMAQLQPGIVLAFFSFVGFESATALGNEATLPHRAIPRAILIAILGPALLFVLASYTMVGAFPGTPRLDQVDGPLIAMAARLGWDTAGWLIEAGIALCFFVAFLSSINAGSRIIHALAGDGYFPKAAGRIHHRHGTPRTALTMIAVFGFCSGAALLAAGVPLADAYGWLSTMATYGYLLAYLLVALAAPVYLHRTARLRTRHILVSAIAVILLAIPIVGSVYPAPEGAYRILPYVFAAFVGLHAVFMLARRSGVPLPQSLGK
jgi:amino acid transporter